MLEKKNEILTAIGRELPNMTESEKNYLIGFFGRLCRCHRNCFAPGVDPEQRVRPSRAGGAGQRVKTPRQGWGGKEVMRVEVTIRGDPKEIADLVIAVQGQRHKTISVSGAATTKMDKTNLANAIRSILMETALAENQLQQPDSTEHTQSRRRISG